MWVLGVFLKDFNVSLKDMYYEIKKTGDIFVIHNAPEALFDYEEKITTHAKIRKS